jgi:hypothetical protein
LLPSPDSPYQVVPPLTLPGQGVERPLFLVGVDFGQLADYSALSVLQRHPPHGKPAEYQIRHLKRWPLGTPYPRIVDDVAALVNAPPLRDCAIVAADHTGVGVAVLDLLRDAQLRASLRAISIHGGDAASDDGGMRYSVPKRDLVSVVSVLLQTGRLKAAASLPEAEVLMSELQAFEVKFSASGHDSYGVWRENKHDDLVLSVAMAAWVGEHANGVLEWY